MRGAVLAALLAAAGLTDVLAIPIHELLTSPVKTRTRNVFDGTFAVEGAAAVGGSEDNKGRNGTKRAYSAVPDGLFPVDDYTGSENPAVAPPSTEPAAESPANAAEASPRDPDLVRNVKQDVPSRKVETPFGTPQMEQLQAAPRSPHRRVNSTRRHPDYPIEYDNGHAVAQPQLSEKDLENLERALRAATVDGDDSRTLSNLARFVDHPQEAQSATPAGPEAAAAAAPVDTPAASDGGVVRVPSPEAAPSTLVEPNSAATVAAPATDLNADDDNLDVPVAIPSPIQVEAEDDNLDPTSSPLPPTSAPVVANAEQQTTEVPTNPRGVPVQPPQVARVATHESSVLEGTEQGVVAAAATPSKDVPLGETNKAAVGGDAAALADVDEDAAAAAGATAEPLVQTSSEPTATDVKPLSFDGIDDLDDDLKQPQTPEVQPVEEPVKRVAANVRPGGPLPPSMSAADFQAQEGEIERQRKELQQVMMQIGHLKSDIRKDSAN